MKLSKITASALAGVGLFLSALAADAATVGGASFSTNGELTTSKEVDGYSLNVSGSFLAESLISDFDAVKSYEVGISLSLFGSPIVDEFAVLPPLSIGDVFDSIGISDPASLFTPAPGPSSGTVDFFGLPVDYSLSNIITTATSISADFTLALFAPDALLDDLDFPLFPMSSVPFSAELSISPVPVPAALPLALSGVALLGGLGLRRRRRAA